MSLFHQGRRLPAPAQFLAADAVRRPNRGGSGFCKRVGQLGGKLVLGLASLLAPVPGGIGQEPWVTAIDAPHNNFQIYNASDGPMNLEGWSFGDGSGNALELHGTIEPRAFRWFYASFGLRNGGEWVSLEGPNQGRHTFVYRGHSAEVNWGFPILDGQVQVTRGMMLPRLQDGLPPRAKTATIVITEIMFRPLDDGPGFAADDDREFVEIKNLGSEPVDLSGWTVGVDASSQIGPGAVVPPGGYRLLAWNRERMAELAGVDAVIGALPSRLGNGGDQIRLQDAARNLVTEVTYDPNWQLMADGLGHSLVLREDDSIPARPNDPGIWRASAARGGSPGRADPTPPIHPRVVVNEVLANAHLPYEDAIEFLNLDDQPADIGGWYLTDRLDRPTKFRLPMGTTVPARGFLAIDAHTFDSTEDLTGFGLDAGGDGVWLLSADAGGALSGYVHGFEFGGADPDVSVGRFVSAAGREQFGPMNELTLGGPNSAWNPGPLILSEVCLSPEYFEDEQTNLWWIQYVELENRTDHPVVLSEPTITAHATNGWSLGGAISLTLPGMTLPPRGQAVVFGVHDASSRNGDPPTLPIQPESVRRLLSLPEHVPIVGPWNGRLAWSAGAVELRAPGWSEDHTPVGVQVDRMSYHFRGAWPGIRPWRDVALQRVSPDTFGGDPASWCLALRSPGARYQTGAVASVTIERNRVQDDGTNYLGFDIATARATGPGPYSIQWFWDENFWGYEEHRTNEVNRAMMGPATGDTVCAVANPFGLTLVPVRFPAQAPRTVQITSPTASHVFVPGALLHLEGTTRGNCMYGCGYPMVVVRDGPRMYRPKVGTNGVWSFDLPLLQRLSPIEVFCVDLYGNASVTNHLQADRDRLPMRVTITGLGTTLGVTNGQPVWAGSQEQITAVPDPGQVFLHWTNLRGDLLSTNPVYQFRAGDLDALHATFLSFPDWFARQPFTFLPGGPGTAIGLTNGQPLMAGNHYSVRAQPAPGHVFVNWVTDHGAHLSSDPEFTFVAGAFHGLTANFVAANHFADLQGTHYGGFADERRLDFGRAGAITFTVTPGGRCSGKLSLGAISQSFVGSVDTGRVARARVTFRDGSSLDLNLALRHGGGEFSGTATASGVALGPIAGHRIWRKLPSGSRMAAGRTVWDFAGITEAGADASAGGAGWISNPAPLSLRVKSSGRFGLTGRLPDRTKLQASGPVMENGWVPIRARLDAGRGSFQGWLTGAGDQMDPLEWSSAATAERPGTLRHVRLRGRVAP